MPTMDGRFIRRSRRVAYENPWLTLWHDEVTRPDGSPGIYGVVHFANVAVGVVAVDAEDRVVLVGQHRYSLADNVTDPQRYEEDRRKLYAENLEIILKAWDNDTFSHKGDFWTIPTPTTHWPAQTMTREMGGRSLDPDGNLVEVGTARTSVI